MNRKELNRIGMILNCKGTGKPGPCKGGGRGKVVQAGGKPKAPNLHEDIVTVHGKKYKLGGSISYKGQKGTLVSTDPNGKQLFIKVGDKYHTVSGAKLGFVSNQLSHDISESVP